MEEYFLRHGCESDLNELSKLWNICFPESPEFSVFFFEKMYSHKTVRLATHSGKIAAALYIFPYSFSKDGERDLKAYYIYGVGTNPEMRGRGLAGLLLKETLKEAAQKGIDLCMLVPQNESLFGFYEKFGFTPAFGMHQEIYSLAGTANSAVRKACAEDIPSINSIYEKSFSSKLHVERSFEEWKLLIEEFELSNGGIYVLEEKGEILAYCTYDCENDVAFVREAAAENKVNVQKLLVGIAQAAKVSELKLIKPGGEDCYGSVCPLSAAAKEIDFKNAYMNLMHS